MGLALLQDLATFACSLLLSLYLTPLIRTGAMRFGVMDHPDGGLKTQREAVPYLGGIAVYLAFLLTVALIFDFGPQLLGLMLGGTMMAMLGLFDDLKVLPPHLKLLGQLLAAWVMLKSGIAIELEIVPRGVALALSVLWLVGVTNAVNIVDVSDGLCSGTAAVAALALYAVALHNGNGAIASTTLALGGAVWGFYPTNRAPARMYLGDTGSLFVGFMLAALSMIGAYTHKSVWGALAPLAILCVPLLDLVLVSGARLAQGRSPLRGSPDHLALRLKARGWSASQVARAAMLLQGVGAAVAWGLICCEPPVAAWLAAAGAGLFCLLWLGLWRLPAPRPRVAP